MKTADKNYIIRTVEAIDLDQVFQMLVDLVKHEGSFDYFKLTRTRLEAELFGTNADWHCLVVAYPDNELLGFCLYSYANINRAFNFTSMIQVDHLYVKPGYRNLNLGHHLVSHLCLSGESGVI